MKQIAIIGSGSWGVALAIHLAKNGNKVKIWSFSEDEAILLNNEKKCKFLPQAVIPDNIECRNSYEEVIKGADIILHVTPSKFTRDTVKQYKQYVDVKKQPIVVCSKGIEKETALTLDEVIKQEIPDARIGALSGPSHAEEVAMGKLTGLIAASEHALNSIKFRELLRVPGLMVYSSLDVIGVQICAAAKNVVAVVYGALDAVSEHSDIFGDNSESLLLAAGLNELQTIGFAMGATHAETFTSIAGVGDLDVTCRSKYGRNRRFGQDIIKTDILSKFKNLDDLIARIGEIGYLSEGAVACKFIHQIAEKHNLKLPICDSLYRILNKEIEPMALLQELMMQGKMEPEED